MSLTAEPLVGPEVCLYPAGLEDAGELVAVLADPRLYRFIGGGPPTLAELDARLRHQADGPPPDRHETWLNWIVRSTGEHRAMGTMQATVRHHSDGDMAELAWVIGAAHQGRGVARASAALVAGWLRAHAVTSLCAHIHPGHAASQAVAASLGLRPTRQVVDGEIRWLSTPPPQEAA